MEELSGECRMYTDRGIEVNAPQDRRKKARKRVLIGIGALAVFFAIGVFALIHGRTIVVLKLANADINDHNLNYEASLGRALTRLGGRRKAFHSVSGYLRLPDWIAQHKRTALLIMGQCGDEAIPILIPRMNDGQLEAIAALSAIGPHAAPALLTGVHHGNPIVRACAIEVMGAMAANDGTGTVLSEHITREIAAMLKDPDVAVRVSAILALSGIASSGDVVGDELEETLGDSEYEVRILGAITLLRRGTRLHHREEAFLMLQHIFEGECIDQRGFCLRAILGMEVKDRQPIVPLLECVLPNLRDMDRDLARRILSESAQATKSRPGSGSE